MGRHITLACERLDTKGALDCSGLVGVVFGPFFSARHNPLLVGIPLDVVLQTHRVAKRVLAGGADEKGQCCVIG